MTHPCRPLAALIVALAGACPSLASAWGGYGPPPYGPPAYYPPPYPQLAPWLPPGPGYPGWPVEAPSTGAEDRGAPTQPGLGRPPVESAASAAERANRVAPFGEPWMPPPGFEGALGPRDWGPPPAPGSIRISRDANADAYLVRIDIGDAKPDDIRIAPAGRGLAITRKSEAQTVHEDSFDEGRGYRRSFSVSRGTSRRRLTLPPDADLAGMTREVADKAIVLRIPRTQGGGFRPYSDPAPAVPQHQAGPHSGPTP